MSDGNTYTAARGGVGGAGNTSYATPTNTVPYQYTEGTDGDELIIELELKTIADIGLVGFPNAGKSTLLRVLSRAKSKVADYAFTTLNPHIGIMDWNQYEEQIAIADIPGLLPGAHRNYGLGHAFLRHIERCSILVIVLNVREKEPGETDNHLQSQNNKEERNLEGASINVERSELETATTTEPVNSRHNSPSLYGKGKLNANEVLPLAAQYQILQDELELYKEGLVNKVKLVVINKVDLEGGEKSVLEFINDSPGLGLPLVPVSGMKEWNIQELKEALYTLYNNNNNNNPSFFGRICPFRCPRGS
uniref:OBG-type G domain-containing protein n=1 Tax=Amphimedon queenslandica TaxID=400682 RepID=A0A1X7TF50_AMPQE